MVNAIKRLFLDPDSSVRKVARSFLKSILAIGLLLMIGMLISYYLIIKVA